MTDQATATRAGLTAAVLADHRRLARAQKPGAGVPLYMRSVNRRLGRALAAVLAQTRATPDQVTAASVVAFVAGIGLVVALAPSWPVLVAAVLLLELGFALDAADGQLARLTGRGSAAGEWVDHVVDAARQVTFHLGVLVALYRFGGVSDGWLVVPIAFTVFASTRFFAQILAEQLHRQRGAAGGEAVAGLGASRFATALQTPSDPGVLNLLLLLLPWGGLFVAAYGACAAINAAMLALTLVRRRQGLLAPVREEAAS